MDFKTPFEMEVSTRKLRNGNKIKIVLEAPFNEEMFHKLVDYQFKNVDVTIVENKGEQSELPGIDLDDVQDSGLSLDLED